MSLSNEFEAVVLSFDLRVRQVLFAFFPQRLFHLPQPKSTVVTNNINGGSFAPKCPSITLSSRNNVHILLNGFACYFVETNIITGWIKFRSKVFFVFFFFNE